MPVLTICNHKGGTGKTTSSIHLAAALGHRGQRVLVVDLDPQGFLTRMLGCQEPPPEHSALGLLNAEADLRTFPVQSVSGFDLIGSSMALTKALRQLTKPTDVLWLRETVGAGHDYDVILLDTAAALSVFTMNALVASDLVVIPVTPEYQPVVGAEQTWQTCGLVQSKLNPRMETPRFLLTQVDARLNRHARYSAYLREKYGEAVLETPIRTSSSLAVASRDGRTVFDNRTPTRGAEDYSSAAAEIEALVFEPDRPVAKATTDRPATPPPNAERAAPPETAVPPSVPEPATSSPAAAPSADRSAEQGPEADPFAHPIVFSLHADPALRQPLAEEVAETPAPAPEPVVERPPAAEPESPPAPEPEPQPEPEPEPAPAPIWTRLWRG